jgi:GT2 family glycosyltransferase
MHQYSLNVITNKPEKFSPIVKSLAPEQVSYYDGSGHPSFSSIVNRCTAASGAETVIIMSDKVLPRKEHVASTLALLDAGYGFVALYRFAFFGFRKELFRRIGGLDEGYVGGGYEDDDYYIRLVENDIAMWVTHDVPYTPGVSSWDPSISRLYHSSKWDFDIEGRKIRRKMQDTPCGYDFGPSVATTWLSGRGHSYTPLPQVAQYFYYSIEGIKDV